MNVAVVCFGALRDHLPHGSNGNRAVIELGGKATVLDAVRSLGVPERLVYVLLVNGEREKLEHELAEGDEITLMPPFSGGASDLHGRSPKEMRRDRCDWALASALMSEYHDTEWGVPLHDERGQFEFLVLEGVQAGLSWSTVLNKRANYRAALDGFNPEKIARYDDDKIEDLLTDKGLIRNRMKMNAAVANARAFLQVRDSMGSFSDYLWSFVDGSPLINHFKKMDDLPAETDISRAMSKDLKRRGFKFVGPTICYAHMQATGMVNDHVVGCWRHAELAGEPGPLGPNDTT